MASSGDLQLVRRLGTFIITVLLMATSGTVAAKDGPEAARGTTSFGGELQVVEAHEVLPPEAPRAASNTKIAIGSTPLSDGFEGPFPGGWQLYHDGPDVDWGKTSYRRSAGSYSL
jgi:hypothetical protein